MTNNILENEVKIENNLIKNNEKNNNFFDTVLGKSINTGIDIGIRAIFPNYIENQIIDIKDNFIEFGLKDGIKKSIEDALNVGKSIAGIFTGKFEDLNQIHNVIKTGGLIDNVSDLLNDILDKTKEKGIISMNTLKTLKQGKNIILSNIEKNIEKTFENQEIGINNLEKSIKNWEKYFKNRDFDNMEKEISIIEKEVYNLAPIEKILGEVNKIENIHNIIKNNGYKFDLTQEQLDLAEKLK